MRYYSDLSDEDWHDLFVGGDDDAGNILIEGCWEFAEGKARRYVAGAHASTDVICLSQDVTITVFVEYWRSVKRHGCKYNRSTGPFRGWLAGCVRHRAIDALRGLGREDLVASIDDTETSDEGSPAPEKRLRARIEKAMKANPDQTFDDTLTEAIALRECLQALPPKLRDIVVLAAEGFSYDEIAQRLNIPKGTVGRRLHNARARLRQCLDRAERRRTNGERKEGGNGPTNTIGEDNDDDK